MNVHYRLELFAIAIFMKLTAIGMALEPTQSHIRALSPAVTVLAVVIFLTAMLYKMFEHK